MLKIKTERLDRLGLTSGYPTGTPLHFLLRARYVWVFPCCQFYKHFEMHWSWPGFEGTNDSHISATKPINIFWQDTKAKQILADMGLSNNNSSRCCFFIISWPPRHILFMLISSIIQNYVTRSQAVISAAHQNTDADISPKNTPLDMRPVPYSE